MLKWLEPSIQSRVEEVTDYCDEQQSDSYRKFMELIKGDVSASQLENLYISRTREIVDFAYRKGLEDGLSTRSVPNPSPIR